MHLTRRLFSELTENRTENRLQQLLRGADRLRRIIVKRSADPRDVTLQLSNLKDRSGLVQIIKRHDLTREELGVQTGLMFFEPRLQSDRVHDSVRATLRAFQDPWDHFHHATAVVRIVP